MVVVVVVGNLVGCNMVAGNAAPEFFLSLAKKTHTTHTIGPRRLDTVVLRDVSKGVDVGAGSVVVSVTGSFRSDPDLSVQIRV